MPRRLMAMTLAALALSATVARADDWGPRQLFIGEFVLHGVTGDSILPMTFHDRMLLAAAASDGEFSHAEGRLAVAELLRRVTLAGGEAGFGTEGFVGADIVVRPRGGDVHRQIRYLGEKLAEAEQQGGWGTESIDGSE